jgi:hypothetical protein
MLIAKTITLVVLAVIAWEDFRYRAIHWSLLLVLALCLALPALQDRPLLSWWWDMRSNILFMLVQFTLAFGILMIKHGQWENPLDRFIGLGDILFLLVLAAGLSRWSFLFFYLSGLLLCLPTYLLMRWLKPRMTPSIPLAGLLSIYLGFWMVLHLTGHAAAFYADGIGPNPMFHG